MTAKPERNRKRSEGEEAVISTFSRDNEWFFFLVSCSLSVSVFMLHVRIHLVSARMLKPVINSDVTVLKKLFPFQGGFPR